MFSKNRNKNYNISYEEFMSSENYFIDPDNEVINEKSKNKNFWNNDEEESSSSRQIGTGKSFLKQTNPILTYVKEKSPESSTLNAGKSYSQDSELRLNLNHSSDKSQISTNNYDAPNGNDMYAHPMTFEGITDTNFGGSYSPTLEGGNSKVKVIKPTNGIETIKSNITTIPIDKSHDNFQQSLDRTDKEHLLSKVSLLDSFEGHKLDRSIVKNDERNSTVDSDFDIKKMDQVADSYYKNSINPASGDSYNYTQGITNITDTVLGDTTAANLSAIHRQYEKYTNKNSNDYTPDTNVPMSETIKEIYTDKSSRYDDDAMVNLDSTIHSKSFALKLVHIEDPSSHASPTPTPRPRNKNKTSNSDNSELSIVKDESKINMANKKIDSDDKPISSRYAHVKSSGYGSKSITPQKNSVSISTKSQPVSTKLKVNQQNIIPSTIKNNQTSVKPKQQQTKPIGVNRSKSASRSNDAENSSRTVPGNETYYLHRNNSEDHLDIFYRDHMDKQQGEWHENWLEERKIVKKLQADSLIQERDFKRQIESTTQKYEEKISQLESQLIRIKQQLQAKPDLNYKLLGPAVTKEDIARIELEMKEQNNILAAYEKDNERLCQEIKILKQYKKGEDKIDSIENERLISQFVSLKAELESKEIEMRNLKQIVKENRFMNRNGHVENKELYLQEISDLKNELKNLNNRYLTCESDKRQAELKLDKLTLETEKRMGQYENEMEIEKTEKEKLKELHKSEIDDLKRKIKWYLENQAIIDQNSKKIKTKDNEISDLKNQLESAHSMKISCNIRAKERLADSAKIKRLEDEIMSLKDDLYSLVKGKNIGNVAEKRTVQFLEDKIKCLEENNNNVINKENNALRSLQQQFEAMKFQYEEKIKDLELDLMKNLDSKTNSEKKTRINELRSKVDELNQELGKRSQIINHLKADLKKSNKLANEDSNKEKKIKSMCRIELANRTDMLQKELHDKDVEIQRLTIQNTYLKNKERQENDMTANHLSPGQLELQAENARYKSQIIHFTRDIDQYKQALEELKLSAMQNEERIHKECQMEIRKLEEFHRENLNNVKVDYANRHSESDTANFQSQIEMQKNYINHLQSQITDFTIKIKECDFKENELTEAKERIQLLTTELADLRLIWSKKPGLEMIDRLRSKIMQLELKENEKTKQLDEYVQKVVKNDTKQYQGEVERWRSIVAKKNQNLLRIQQELNHLLEALEELRRQGITIPKFNKIII